MGLNQQRRGYGRVDVSRMCPTSRENVPKCCWWEIAIQSDTNRGRSNRQRWKRRDCIGMYPGGRKLHQHSI